MAVLFGHCPKHLPCLGSGKSSHLARRVAGNEGIRSDALRDDSICRYYTSLADRYSRTNRGAGSNPDVIFDEDRSNFAVRCREVGESFRGFCGMSGHIKEVHSTSDLAIIADRDTSTDGELAVVADETAAPDRQSRVAGVTRRKEDGAFSANRYMITNRDFAVAGNPWQEHSRVQVLSIAFAVGLEEWLAEEYPDYEVINRTKQQEQSQRSAYDDARRWQAEGHHAAIDASSQSRQPLVRCRHIAMKSHNRGSSFYLHVGVSLARNVWNLFFACALRIFKVDIAR